MITLREASKEDWRRDRHNPTEDINTGCLQRIADAVETMALKNDDLISQINWHKIVIENLEHHNIKLEHQIAAYKGIIKKMKEKE